MNYYSYGMKLVFIESLDQEKHQVFEYQNIELSVFCQYMNMMMFFALARIG